MSIESDDFEFDGGVAREREPLPDEAHWPTPCADTEVVLEYKVYIRSGGKPHQIEEMQDKWTRSIRTFGDDSIIRIKAGTIYVTDSRGLLVSRGELNNGS